MMIGKVVQGTQGFYQRSGVQATGFGCVEVDTSVYAIPTSESVRKWTETCPRGFVMHFKAFGPLCKHPFDCKVLPIALRSPVITGQLLISDLSVERQDAIWKAFNDSLMPAYLEGKLGLVIFQYNLAFTPCEESREYLALCRKKLHSSYKMAVDFRNRKWLNDLDSTGAFLRSLCAEGICICASDDLVHELYHTPKPSRPEVAPTILTAAGSSTCMYIRIHRREGTERVLRDEEIANWIARIESALSDSRYPIRGPLYVLWGTDHADQPAINARKLHKALPENLRFDWIKYAMQNSDIFRGVSNKSCKRDKNTVIDYNHTHDCEILRKVVEEHQSTHMDTDTSSCKLSSDKGNIYLSFCCAQHEKFIYEPIDITRSKLRRLKEDDDER